MLSRKIIGIAFLPWLLLAGVIVAGIAVFLVEEPEPEPPDCVLMADPEPELEPTPAEEQRVDVFPASWQMSTHVANGTWIHHFDIDPVSGFCVALSTSTSTGERTARGGRLPECLNGPNKIHPNAWSRATAVESPDGYLDLVWTPYTEQQIPPMSFGFTTFDGVRPVGDGTTQVSSATFSKTMEMHLPSRLQDDQPHQMQFAHLGDGVYIRFLSEVLPSSGERLCGKDAATEAQFTSHYKMRKPDGEVIDESKADKPFTAKRSHVIKGYAKALSNMCVGDSATVFIPKEQAYGDDSRRGGDVIFDIDLIQIADPR